MMRIFHARTSRSQKGFSLVELLIVMGLMSILLLVLTDMFTSMLNVQTSTKAHSSVTEDGRFILSRLSYDVQRASSVTTPEYLNISTSGVGTNTATINWSTVGSSSSQVEYG